MGSFEHVQNFPPDKTDRDVRLMYVRYPLPYGLEDNRVIDNVQIGFTKNARTSDHMFVMKSIIDKCIKFHAKRYKLVKIFKICFFRRKRKETIIESSFRCFYCQLLHETNI